jgi:hypothetical protein
MKTMQNPEEKLTQEQLDLAKQQKAEMEQHLDEELPFMRKQAEYNELMTRTLKAQFEYMMIQHKMAEYVNHQQEMQKKSEDNEGKPQGEA